MATHPWAVPSLHQPLYVHTTLEPYESTWVCDRPLGAAVGPSPTLHWCQCVTHPPPVPGSPSPGSIGQGPCGKQRPLTWVRMSSWNWKSKADTRRRVRGFSHWMRQWDLLQCTVMLWGGLYLSATRTQDTPLSPRAASGPQRGGPLHSACLGGAAPRGRRQRWVWRPETGSVDMCVITGAWSPRWDP